MAGRTTALHEFGAHSTTVHCMTLGKQLLATGGEDRLVNVWRVDNGANIHSLEAGHSSTVIFEKVDTWSTPAFVRQSEANRSPSARAIATQ